MKLMLGCLVDEIDLHMSHQPPLLPYAQVIVTNIVSIAMLYLVSRLPSAFMSLQVLAWVK